MPSPIPVPRRLPGHFERFEILNLSPNVVVLEFYAVRDPVDSRYPETGPAAAFILPGDSFVQEPPELLPDPITMPQVVSSEVSFQGPFTMTVTAPPGMFVAEVVFEVTDFDVWEARPRFVAR
jgi:hypothetical protein